MRIEGMIVIVVLFIALVTVVSYPVHLIVFAKKFIKSRRRLDGTPIKTSRIATHTFLSAIVIIVAAMTMRNIMKFPHHSPQSEAKTNLGAIYIAQLSYFSTTNTYAGQDPAFPLGPKDAFALINWEPAGQNRYAYYCDAGVIANKLPLGREMPLPDRDWPVALQPKASKSGFTCMAVGNVDADTTLDVWSINDAKILVNNLNDV